LVIAGPEDATAQAERIVRRMLEAAVRGAQMTPHDVALAAADSRDREAHRELPATMLRTNRGKEIRPRSRGQREFVDAIERHALTMCIGPAGTGKTFLAVVMAVRALKSRRVSRLILTRPAVEAGEKLGFLPGDVKDKIDPYLRPLYDALAELLDDATVAKYIERGIIEIAPLAFMRGRTLSDAFIILDEAQNATRAQLKMFLTRLGDGSTMVVNGDITQIDLPRGAHSGLPEAPKRFGEIEEIAILTLTEADVVRHPLVTKIIRAYDDARRPVE
jgi:phosphate starvation-inducible protein PhoH and related proteins